LGAKPLGFGPAKIHAQQHLRPVGGIDAAGTREDAHDGIVRVEFAVEIGRHLQCFDRSLNAVEVGIDLALGRGIGVEKFEHLSRVRKRARGAVDTRDLLFEVGQQLHRRLRPFGVVPETVGTGSLVEFGYLTRLGSVVKDAP